MYVSVATAMRIFDEYADIPVKPLPAILCIDEVYVVKYTQKVYACVLVDFQSKEKYELANHLSKIDKKYRDQVLYISMDMWEPYRDIIHLYFKKAKVCIDNFHVVELINYAFSKVHIRTLKGYDKANDEYYLLKKSSWLLNINYDDIEFDRRIHLHKNISYFFRKDVPVSDILNLFLSFNCELEIAYTLKEEFNDINKLCNFETTEAALDKFIEDLIIFNIEEFKSVVSALKNWKQEIINSFDLFDNRRISNGSVESVNSKIKLIKRNANGYRNLTDLENVFYIL